MGFSRINGIQHLGVGTSDLITTWKWYRKHFGLDIPMFDSVAEAPLMDVYTRNKTVNKRAAMILNIQGGCPIEVVELRSNPTTEPSFEVHLGDLGIFAGKFKSPNFDAAAKKIISANDGALGEVESLPNGGKVLNLKDPNGLFFQLVEGDKFFSEGPHLTGGTAGCLIGSSDIEKTKNFYAALGYDEVVYEAEGVFEDFKHFPGGEGKFKRALLKQSNQPGGGFANATGVTWIELVEALDREPKKIYQDRIWGDTGFVHIGFDVKGMDQVEKDLTAIGHPFTCDSSNGLHMGKTRVHCTYVEDPDGTLIELIEVYKIPLIEKWGLFLNVEKRDPLKPLPNWMLKSMRFSRVKDDYWEKKDI